MKTQYKYIEFRPCEDTWVCFNLESGESLGWVEWYHSQRQWVFRPFPRTEYSEDCLRDIINYMHQLKEA